MNTIEKLKNSNTHRLSINPYGDKINATTDFVPNTNGKPLLKQVDGFQVYTPQLITNGDFSDGTTGWTARAGSSQNVVNDINTITATATGETVGIQQSGLPVPNTNKFYGILRYNSQSSNNIHLYTGGLNWNLAIVQNTWDIKSIIASVTSDTVFRIYQSMNSGETLQIDYVYLFNLTTLIANKQYSPLFNTTFDLMSDEQIKIQMDSWVQLGILPNANLQAITEYKGENGGEELV